MAFSPDDRLSGKELTPDEALARMEQFCVYRERCPQEVQRKIRELGMKGETADQIYRVLEGDGFFDETRFAIAFAGGKFRVNQWGRIRIRLELQRRAIAPAIIRQALDVIDENEYRRVLAQLTDKKKQRYRSVIDAKARASIAAALIRAGYEPELVFQQV